jgi:hypothetical protein
MKRRLQSTGLCLALLMFSILGASGALAQTWISDPGTPDSLWVPDVDWRGDTLFALNIWTTTDDSLLTAQIVLSWPNPALRLDSVKLNVGRWNVGGYHKWTQAGAANTVALAFLPTTKRLPPGSGIVARLFFGRDSAYTFDADVQIDTAQIYPAPPLAPYQTVFSAAANNPFLPTAVVSGVVAFSPCICTRHGDMVDDGEPNAMDLGFMIDALFAGGPLPITDPDCPHQHRGDMNCDNNFDAIDLAVLIDYLFAGQAGPCDPCTDL